MGNQQSNEQPLNEIPIQEITELPAPDNTEKLAIAQAITTAIQSQFPLENITKFSQVIHEEQSTRETEGTEKKKWEDIYSPLQRVNLMGLEYLPSLLFTIVNELHSSYDEASLGTEILLIKSEDIVVEEKIQAIIREVGNKYQVKLYILSSVRNGTIFEFMPAEFIENDSNVLIFAHSNESNQFFPVITQPVNLLFQYSSPDFENLISSVEANYNTVREKLRQLEIDVNQTSREDNIQINIIGVGGKNRLLSELLGCQIFPKKLKYQVKIAYSQLPSIFGVKREIKTPISFENELRSFDRIYYQLNQLNNQFTKSKFDYILLSLPSPILQGLKIIRNSLLANEKLIQKSLSESSAIIWLTNSHPTKMLKVNKILLEQQISWKYQQNNHLSNVPIQLVKKVENIILWQNSDINLQYIHYHFGNIPNPSIGDDRITEILYDPMQILKDQFGNEYKALYFPALQLIVELITKIRHQALSNLSHQLQLDIIDKGFRFQRLQIPWNDLKARMKRIDAVWNENKNNYLKYCKSNVKAQLLNNFDNHFDDFLNQFYIDIKLLVLNQPAPSSDDDLNFLLFSLISSNLLRIIGTSNFIGGILEHGKELFYGIIYEVMEINNILSGRVITDGIHHKLGELESNIFNLMNPKTIMKSMVSYLMPNNLSYFQKNPEKFLQSQIKQQIESFFENPKFFVDIFEPISAYLLKAKELIHSHAQPKVKFLSYEDQARFLTFRSSLALFDIFYLYNCGNLNPSELWNYKSSPVEIKSITPRGYLFVSEMDNSAELIIQFYNQLTLIQKLKHKNIIQLLGWGMYPILVNEDETYQFYSDQPNAYLFQCVYESNLPLTDYWDSYKPSNPSERVAEFKKFMEQSLSALLFIHQNFILHRDIKAASFYVNQNGDLLVSNIGASKSVQEAQQTIIGTHAYKAPEVLQKEFTYKSDVYSFGIFIWELWYRKPFPLPTLDRSINIWKDEDLTECETLLFEQVKSIFASCTSENPASRPSFDVLQQLSTFSDI